MAVANITATALSNISNFIPYWWEKKIYVDAIRKEFFAKFFGEQASGSPIIIKDKLMKGDGGNRIYVNLIGNLETMGVTEENVLSGNEGVLANSNFYVTPLLIRNAIAFNDLAKARSIVDLVQNAGVALADWSARYLDDRIFFALAPVGSTTVPTTQLYPNGHTAATLVTGDKLTLDLISVVRTTLENQGAKPIEVKVGKNRQEVPIYAMVVSEMDAYHLKATDAWKLANADALPAGYDNPIFTGAIGMYDGVVLYTYSSRGSALGTPIRPEVLVISGSNGGTALKVGHNTDTTVDWTKYFPSSGYLYVAGGNAETIAYSAKAAVNP